MSKIELALKPDAGEASRVAPDAAALLNALPHPVVVVDRRDDIAYLNAAGEQFLAGSLASLAGTNLQNLIPHDNPLLSLVGKVRKTGNSMTEYGIRLKTPRIGAHWVSVDGAPMGGGSGHVVLMLQEQSIAGKIDRSITHRGAARSVTALAAMLGHEVKNPLSGIRGAAQLLDGLVAPEDRELTRLIVEEADRIVALLERMDVFTERPRLERRAVNIHEVLDHVILLQQSAGTKPVRFEVRYDPSLPPVYGDRDQLVQVFLNIIKNAVEAIDIEGGEVVVRTAYQHGVRLAVPGSEARMHLPLMVQIQDDGPGIPDDMRRHMFDPFITTKPGGTGLGLALVAKFVDDHGGVIDVESQPRRTVFSVMLPVILKPEEATGER